jgi:hypothetical protein
MQFELLLPPLRHFREAVCILYVVSTFVKANLLSLRRSVDIATSSWAGRSHLAPDHGASEEPCIPVGHIQATEES